MISSQPTKTAVLSKFFYEESTTRSTIRSMAQRHPEGHTLTVTLNTTLALIDQFSRSLAPTSSLPNNTHNSTAVDEGANPSSPSPLPLLSTCAASLKAQSTKMSLLTITPPFTLSAINTVLVTLNDSVLPSLVTGALLVTNESYTASFSAEVHSQVRGTLNDLRTLLASVESRGKDGKPKHEMGEGDKGNVTEAVGRVWESCDAIMQLANEGIGGFVIRKAESWLSLIKDAVSELQDWDPEDEDDVDELFNDALDNHSDEDDESLPNGIQGEEETTAKADPKDVLEAKTSALRILTRVPQSVHVVIKQRLQKWRLQVKENISEERRQILDSLMANLKGISETVDETAETLYMGDLLECKKLLRRVWEMTVQVVEAVKQPRHGHDQDDSGATKEDKYIDRALEWIKQVEPGAATIQDAAWNAFSQHSGDG